MHFICVIAMAIIILAPLVKIKKELIWLLLMCSVVPSLFFTFRIQYWYKDHEGNYAGMLILAGSMSLLILCEVLKSRLNYIVRNKYAFIVSICETIVVGVGIWMSTFYGAKVYALALCIFIILFLTPRAIICNTFVYVGICFSAVLGSVLVYYYSGGAHVGIYEIGIRFNIFIYFVFIVGLLWSLAKYRRYVASSSLSKLGFVALLTCLITACFDDYILSFPLCIYYLIYAICCTNFENIDYESFDVHDYFTEIKRDGIKKIRLSYCVVLPHVVSIFILGPLEIYQANRYGFKFDHKQFIGWVVLLAVLSCIILGLLLSVLTANAHRFFVSLVFSLAVASYIQYMFMNIQLISDDGGPLDFSKLYTYTIINTCIWIALLVCIVVLLYFIKDKWKNIVRCGSIVLSIIQITAVVFIYLNLVNLPGPRYYQFMGDSQYQVGSEENIIIIILDTFSRGDLGKVLIKYPEAIDFLNDFTYYTNASSEYTATFPSIPHMLTGYDCPDSIGYDTEMERIKWLEEAWNTEECNNFYEDIHDAGYVFDVHTGDSCDIWGAYDDIKDCIDNIEPSTGHIDKCETIKLLIKMSVYRYVPYIIKPKFEVLTFEFDPLVSYDTVSSQELDSDIYKSLLNKGLSTSSVKKMIKIQHSRGMHRPFSYNEKCELLKANDGTVEDTGKGLLLYVNEYLNCLEGIDQYDNSTIIITADHGLSSTDSILFMKLKNEKHENMKIDDKRVFFSDVRATILDVIGCDYEEYGISFLEK